MYLSTSDIASFYSVDPRFFLSRKDSGEFKRNVHYISAGRTLRWNAEEVHKWWTGENDDGKISDENEELLNRLLAV